MEKRVGIYLRVSTKEQSTELQRAETTAFLRARGLTNWKCYEDSQTGTNAIRPALRSLLKDSRERKLDIVVCWKMDRLFRSLRDLLSTLNEFSELGLEFISIKDNLDMTTSTGKLLTHLLGAFAEFEASLIRERVHAGLANAKRKGIKLGRPQKTNFQAVYSLQQEGYSNSVIAKRLNVSKSLISKILNQELKKPIQNHESQVLENTQNEAPDSTVEKTNVNSTHKSAIKGNQS